jgi:hypothetical protein
MATIFTGAQSNNDNTEGVATSRLLTDSSSFRTTLSSRNLYTPDNQYSLENPSNANKVVGAINSIINIVAPFKGFDLSNSVLGRIANPTPLTDISTVLLGRQLMLNSISFLSKNNLPTIKLTNLFDGNKDTHLFTKNVNFRITLKPDTDFLTNFLENVTSFYPKKDYPFTKTATNDDFIKNTGTGQLSSLYQAINQNVYKQSNSTVFTNYSKIADVPIQDQKTIVSNKTYFNFNNTAENPYLEIHPSDGAIQDANQAMISSNSISGKTQEYAPTADYVNNNFGVGNKTPAYTSGVQGSFNDWIDVNTEFSNDDQKNKLVWGRDGVLPDASKRIAQLHGNIDEELKNLTPQSIGGFNIKKGLLEYTRNLLNATEGHNVDITRKAFTNGSKLVGFNGSGLWRAPFQEDSKYAANSGIAGKQGVRQHSMADQYDRFTKAIRFNGNIVYGGNPNSVIYKSVLPTIHPIIDSQGKIDNKNLMFSIENLAVGVISHDDKYGIIDDEYGSHISLSEVGPFNGRIMWFPPYNMEIVETSTAKFESTVMVGRNEPMYNYQNSERTGTITFTLIADYPE